MKYMARLTIWLYSVWSLELARFWSSNQRDIYSPVIIESLPITFNLVIHLWTPQRLINPMNQTAGSIKGKWWIENSSTISDTSEDGAGSPVMPHNSLWHKSMFFFWPINHGPLPDVSHLCLPIHPEHPNSQTQTHLQSVNFLHALL